MTRYYVDAKPIVAGEGPECFRSPLRSGPFGIHAEAERTLRGLLQTGKFWSGTVVTVEEEPDIHDDTDL
jgi:hypothetical protein